MLKGARRGLPMVLAAMVSLMFVSGDAAANPCQGRPFGTVMFQNTVFPSPQITLFLQVTCRNNCAHLLVNGFFSAAAATCNDGWRGWHYTCESGEKLGHSGDVPGNFMAGPFGQIDSVINAMVDGCLQ